MYTLKRLKLSPEPRTDKYLVLAIVVAPKQPQDKLKPPWNTRKTPQSKGPTDRAERVDSVGGTGRHLAFLGKLLPFLGLLRHLID